MAGWNIALLAAGLALIAAVAEVRLRLTMPFISGSEPSPHFVPNVGLMSWRPHSEVRATNRLDYWVVFRTNRLGFADREPISPERAAESCHVTVIGDSYVAASQVPIPEKFHVRLEAFAARELPHLDITTSAFGGGGWAPINELALWDEYARRLRPKLLVLVFHVNDLWGNSSLLRGLGSSMDPDHLPWMTVRRGADGTPRLLPPDPNQRIYRELPREPRHWTELWTSRLWRVPGVGRSYFARWLRAKMSALVWRRRPSSGQVALADILSRRPRYAASLDTWRPPSIWTWDDIMRSAELPRAFEEALELVPFALDGFHERARRDGASLVLLTTHMMGTHGDVAFDRLHAMAEARGIPVIDQYGHIVRSGGLPEDANWAHDGHWNAAGHRWAAEALLGYLKRNPEICDAQVADT